MSGFQPLPEQSGSGFFAIEMKAHIFHKRRADLQPDAKSGTNRNAF
jgi:hypothetical protein